MDFSRRHFFFGSLYDTLQRFFGGSFLSRYAFILPAAAIGFIIAFIFIKKTRLFKILPCI